MKQEALDTGDGYIRIYQDKHGLWRGIWYGQTGKFHDRIGSDELELIEWARSAGFTHAVREYESRANATCLLEGTTDDQA